MVQRLNVRENEKPENARRRFDGQLGVRAWTTPGTEPQQQDTNTRGPWWWNQAEADRTSQMFMEMARAKGMVE
jgi:hypothetical protein